MDPTIKILVPEGMMKAVEDRYGMIYSSGFNPTVVRADLEAALRCVIEREPTDEEGIFLLKQCFSYETNSWEDRYSAEHLRKSKEGIKRLFRHMFLAPEPEVPIDTTYNGKFNGPHILTDRQGWTARCCGNSHGCKWCANEEA